MGVHNTALVEALAEAFGDAVIWLDAFGKICALNSAAERTYGWKRDELTGAEFVTLLPSVRHDFFRSRLELLRSGNAVPPYEGQHLHRSGKVFGVHVALSAARSPELAGVFAVVRSLREEVTTTRFSESFPRLGAFEARNESGAVTVQWTPELYDMYGLPRGTVITAETIARLIYPEDLAAVRDSRAKALQGGLNVYEEEFRIVRPNDGAIRWIRASTRMHRDGAAVISEGVMRDITETKVATAQLAASEERLRQIFESTSDGMLIRDLTGVINFTNLRLDQMFGYERGELLGQNVSRLALPDPQGLARELTGRARGDAHLSRTEFLRKDGTTFYAEVRGEPLRDGAGKVVGGLGTFSDLSERLAQESELAKMRSQLQAAQKLEAIGSLAGGIAHDFNNILTVIITTALVAREDLPEGSPMREEMKEILDASDRAARLVRQLLAFSRKQLLRPRPLELLTLLEQLQPMLARLLGEDIELTVLAPQGVPRVLADPAQMEQVVINLCVNARDAMPMGGKLTINLSAVELDETFCQTHLGASPGRYVMLAVSDTGLGMTQEVRDRIFEPFFSTKGDKGTGLGLSTVFGIVKQSGGTVWVYSEPGKGSTFKVYLPRTDAEAPADAVQQVAAAGGTETVLLVEDEAQVRSLVREVLRQRGYTVLEAASPGDALLISEQHANEVQLLLTDVVMPRMNGRELAQRVKDKWPGIRVLFMSGYTDDAIVQHGVLDGGVDFIEKPLTPDALLRKLRNVLDR
ncbi:MAG: PAS domain S-box protein [Myxococcaceae bacterium]